MATKKRRPTPQETMLGLVSGYWASQLLFVVARLGVADVLAKGPMAVEAIAKRVGAHAQSLYRVLRALASLGIFAESAGRRFRLTPLAQTLRSDRPGSLRNFTVVLCDDYNWQAWGALDHAVTTGGWPFEHVHHTGAFAYLHDHPDKEKAFAAAMASISASENEAVARAYPFGRRKHVVDVGGAHGHLLATILRRHRKLRGVLYDQLQVVESAARSGFVTAADVRARCSTLGGDFFTSVPAGYDTYLMKHIIHDWDDEKSLRILGTCRDAMGADARLLVVDAVIPPGNGANWSKVLDINMMVIPGGQERTRAEFRDLFQRAGLRLLRVHPTASQVSILEAARA